jgi:hypothetical protein
MSRSQKAFGKKTVIDSRRRHHGYNGCVMHGVPRGRYEWRAMDVFFEDEDYFGKAVWGARIGSPNALPETEEDNKKAPVNPLCSARTGQGNKL